MPTHTGLLLDAVAVGNALTTTTVEADPVHPLELVTVSVYVPAAAAVTPGMDGFCNEELNEFGPVHA